mmetsp:Transcript_72253/g.154648  ORF Transcript_72253/g.154648 Transcript_72253/m.154648 type:complete len:265 (-) Transcript_72253:2401-3195(-)
MKAVISESMKGPTMRCGAMGHKPTCDITLWQAISKESSTRNSGWIGLKVRTAQASRVAQVSFVTPTCLAAGSRGAAAASPSAAGAGGCRTRRMPSSSGKAAMFSSRKTCFSLLSSRTRKAKAAGSANQESWWMNSTKGEMPSLTSRTTSMSGSRERRLRICARAAATTSLAGGAVSWPAPSAASGASPAATGRGASGSGVPKCPTTITARGLDSRTESRPWKACRAISTSVSVRVRCSNAGTPPSSCNGNCASFLPARKERSTS